MAASPGVIVKETCIPAYDTSHVGFRKFLLCGALHLLFGLVYIAVGIGYVLIKVIDKNVDAIDQGSEYLYMGIMMAAGIFLSIQTILACKIGAPSSYSAIIGIVALVLTFVNYLIAIGLMLLQMMMIKGNINRNLSHIRQLYILSIMMIVGAIQMCVSLLTLLLLCFCYPPRDGIVRTHFTQARF